MAMHRKLTLPSADTSNYDATTPSVTPETATNGVSISNLENIYWTNPLIHKGINIRANRVIGNGFQLKEAEGINLDPETAKKAKEECENFLKKINYKAFLRQSIINAYVAGNEWTELIYNQFGMLVNVNHGDFNTIDFRRDFIFNKVLLDDNGEPVGYWQHIDNLAYLYAKLTTLGVLDTYKNLEAAVERLNNKETYEIYNDAGEPIGVLTAKKPYYMFLKKEEIAHLSFNNLNDNYFGVSMIIPAYNAMQQLEDITYATAEMVNTIGFPKPVVYVGNEDNPPVQKLIDQAEDAVTDPVRKESFVLPFYMKMEYLNNSSASDIATYPQWYITQVAIGLRVPRELLTGEGEAVYANAKQGSTDFDKDIEADRVHLNKYIRTILSYYLKSRGYLSNELGECSYVPEIKWAQIISEEEATREKMVIDKWNAGLITRAEAREKLELAELEDFDAGNKFINEQKDPQNSVGMVSTEVPPVNMEPEPLNTTAIQAKYNKSETTTTTYSKTPSADELMSYSQDQPMRHNIDVITAQHRLATKREQEIREALSNNTLTDEELSKYMVDNLKMTYREANYYVEQRTEMAKQGPAYKIREYEPKADIKAPKMQPAKKLDPKLNKKFNTKGVDYKEIAVEKTGKEIVTVNKAKAKEIRDELVDGLANDKKLKNIKKDIKQIGNYKDYEVNRIMRTETNNLISTGELENAKAKGLKYKVWQAVNDAKTAPQCKALDGQRVEIEAVFSVDYEDEMGKKGHWEGQQPTAHPNCRCSMRFEAE